eukprot:CAMPEP_0119284110 /NCGR_PEP_ID=MMETSP1329-20130426/29756_1 /TAXON_ID=114041 /ORGANISM="Genus nov. species nov., Strain RCC1024" /LENGTH=244 /DNA_ID=CAMNT_0007284787 /DNA_START=133 /DNA_END=864 /DNA_ORIENTATION=-
MGKATSGAAAAPPPAASAPDAHADATTSPTALAPGPNGSPTAIEASLPPPTEGPTQLETRRVTRDDDDEPAAPAPTKRPAKRPRRAKKADGGRKGKWTIEETEYTTKMIEHFNEGLLELPEGSTLRAYLAQKLRCDPMRITKKFSGAACLGNKVFHASAARPRLNQPEAQRPEAVARAQEELRILEGRFVDACVRSHESKDARMIDLEARFQNSACVVSTPAIDAFIMQSCQPLWNPDGIGGGQ